MGESEVVVSLGPNAGLAAVIGGIVVGIIAVGVGAVRLLLSRRND